MFKAVTNICKVLTFLSIPSIVQTITYWTELAVNTYFSICKHTHLCHTYPPILDCVEIIRKYK